MRTFPLELSVLKKLLGYQCVFRTLGPAILVRSDGFYNTMVMLKASGWSELSGIDYAKLDEDNIEDHSILLAYTLTSQTCDVQTMEIQAIAKGNLPWPSLSGLFASAESVEFNVAGGIGISFVTPNQIVGEEVIER